MSNAKTVRPVLSVVLSFLLVAVPSQIMYGYQGEQPPTAQGAEPTPAPQSAEQIQALVAPIALYPDALVAQVLSAATFPDQVAAAQNWIQGNANLKGQDLLKEADKQPWDPSVKAITAFPSVLDSMAKNLSWTSALGEVYHFQARDVMTAVQTLRAQAQKAGNLKSSSQITVVEQSPSTIVIQPTNPQVVYVPQYNPTVVYGTPYTTPGYTPGEMAAASVLSFGAGIAIGAMMSGGCCSWGWNTWNVNWHSTTVVYGGRPYYGSTVWHGGYGAYGYHGYGGYNAATYRGPAGSATGYRGPGGAGGAYAGYGPGGAYHTGSAAANAYGGAASRTTYAPNGAAHTSGGGYSNVTGQAYHYGATQTAAGGTAYHGSTNTGQHVAGGTTAGGQHWSTSGSGGWANDNGASARAASARGWGSARASGGFQGRRR